MERGSPFGFMARAARLDGQVPAWQIGKLLRPCHSGNQANGTKKSEDSHTNFILVPKAAQRWSDLIPRFTDPLHPVGKRRSVKADQGGHAMTIGHTIIRPNQFSIVGMVAGVVVIPVTILGLLFFVAQLTR